MMNGELAIKVSGLTKSFGEVQAVNGVSFSVRRGELFGFLGPNGAGKTTTINLLTGLARVDAGTVEIGGIDCTRNPKAAQHLIGVVPDESNLYPELTGFENLCFCGALYGMRRREREDRARELLTTFGQSVTFEKKGRSFDRLLLAPISLELVMLAKTSCAILFGIFNAAVPLVIAGFLVDLTQVDWAAALPAVVLMAIASTFLGQFVAVSVSEVFEAQTFSNFFRFPMLFLCGLFFPIASLPVFLRPISYVLPVTYGADALHGAFGGASAMPLALDFALLGVSCAALFALSLRSVRRRWIA